MTSKLKSRNIKVSNKFPKGLQMSIFDFDFKSFGRQFSRFCLIVYLAFMVICSYVMVGEVDYSPISRDAPLTMLIVLAIPAALGYWIGFTHKKYDDKR